MSIPAAGATPVNGQLNSTTANSDFTSAGAGKATGPTTWQHVPTGAYDTPTMTMLPAAPKGSHVREIWNIMITLRTSTVPDVRIHYKNPALL